jgi:hypothetical protein
MARIRSIKPTFFRSRSVKKLTDKAKLVWVGLWNVADDDGRLVDELGILTGDLWALSVSEAKLDKVLDELHGEGRIIRYKVAAQPHRAVPALTPDAFTSSGTESPSQPRARRSSESSPTLTATFTRAVRSVVVTGAPKNRGWRDGGQLSVVRSGVRRIPPHPIRNQSPA